MVPSFDRGLRQVGPTTYAFLQPDGGWGWSNAGLITGDRGSVLVDTFFDLANTRELLGAAAEVTAARPIRTLVNTHHNGDHCWGNQLVEGATIVAHHQARDEMLRAAPPGFIAGVLASEASDGAIGYLKRAFGAFDFAGIEVTPPQITFDETLSLYVDDREVRLLYYGPAHTLGDVVAWVPDDRVLFAGDLCFLGSTPLVWEGSLQNWVTAIDGMLSLEPQVVVPGHGPVTDPDGLRQTQAYLQHVVSEGAKLWEEGVPPAEAAQRIDLGDFASWKDAERLVLNLMRLNLELDGNPASTRIEPLEAFTAMAELELAMR